MSWTFRRLLIALALVISLVSTGTLASFFLKLYREETISSILQSEKGNTQRVASHFDELVRLAELIDINRVTDSREIGFIIEDPCKPTDQVRIGISRYFESDFRKLGLSPQQWGSSFQTFKACEALIAAGKAPMEGFSGDLPVEIVKSPVEIMYPYILALTRTATGHRLSMISLEGFRSAVANTLFVVDRKGKTLWSADGEAYLSQALVDTGISDATIRSIAGEAPTMTQPKVAWLGESGLLASSPIGTSWIMMSLSYAPAALAPVSYVVLQVLLVAAAIFFFSLFIGKRLAEHLVRPLHELTASAELIGAGDFTHRLEGSGPEEFRVVRSAVNTMVEKIAALLEKAKEGAAMEKELLLSQQVQKLLIPQAATEIAGHRIYGQMRPAAYVGGDWWGFTEIPVHDRKTPLLLILVGDATDHGVPPALVTATVKGAQSILSHSWKAAYTSATGGEATPGTAAAVDLQEVVKALNRTVHDAAKGSITMSLFACLLDTDREEMTCVNAGHVLPYLFRPDGSIVVTGGSGRVLGGSVDEEFTDVKTYPWKPGSRLFLYTDGLIDIRRGEENVFGRKDLSKFLRSIPKSRGRELLNKTLRHFENLARGLVPPDDVTVVVCESVERLTPEKPNA